MAIYVDTAFLPYGRMKMCHMFADTTDELIRCSTAVGIGSVHIQYRGTYREHFDVSLRARKDLILHHGARVITYRDTGRYLMFRQEWFRHNLRSCLDEHGGLTFPPLEVMFAEFGITPEQIADNRLERC